MNKIKDHIPKALIRAMKKLIWRINLLRYKKSRCSVYLMNTPCHDNLGDQAITVAEISFIKSFIPEGVAFEEINEHRCNEYCIKILSRHISRDSIICIHGGGNIGSLYPYMHRITQNIVNTFPENRIVIFPQSVFFEDTSEGHAELTKTQECFGNHKDLHIFTRDQRSYHFTQKHFLGSASYLTPDIVATLNRCDTSVEREGILMCMRNDKEKSITDVVVKEIEECCLKHQKVRYTDTMLSIQEYRELGLKVSAKRREQIIDKKLEEFRSAKLAITDRLHGMIFCMITGTPCIALDNTYNKVAEQYYWFRDLPYMQHVSEADDIEELVIEMLSLPAMRYDSESYRELYSLLKQVLLDKLVISESHGGEMP